MSNIVKKIWIAYRHDTMIVHMSSAFANKVFGDCPNTTTVLVTAEVQFNENQTGLVLKISPQVLTEKGRGARFTKPSNSRLDAGGTRSLTVRRPNLALTDFDYTMINKEDWSVNAEGVITIALPIERLNFYVDGFAPKITRNRQGKVAETVTLCDTPRDRLIELVREANDLIVTLPEYSFALADEVLRIRQPEYLV